MSKSVQVAINAKDQTGAAFKSVNDRLSSIGKSVASINFIEMGKLAFEGFKKIGEAGGAASAEAGKNFQSLNDIVGGVTAKIGGAVFGNSAFIKSLKQLLATVTPLITTLISALVPAITSIINGFVRVYEAIRPFIEYVLSYAIPVIQRLGTAGNLLANVWNLAGAALTGNTAKVKQYREENAKLLKELTAPIQRASVSLKSEGSAGLERLGVTARLMKEKPDKEKKEDPSKAIDAQYDALIKLAEAGKLSTLEAMKLADEYDRFRGIVEAGNGTLEERTQALANVAAFEAMVTKQTEAETKALEDRNRANADAIKLQNEELNARIRLVAGGKGTSVDKSALQGERSILRALLPEAKSASARLAIAEQIEEITEALGDGAKEVEKTISFEFGSALENGLKAAFAGGGISGLFGSFFGELQDAIGAGIAGMVKKWITGTGLFMNIQAKLYAAYGAIMKGFAWMLSNPWTAGIGAVAIGAALYGLTRSLGKSASTGTASYAGTGTFNNGNSARMAEGIQQGTATLYIDGRGRYIDTEDPEQLKAFANAFKVATGQGLLIMRKA